MKEKVLSLRLKKRLIFINYSHIIIDGATNEAITIDPAWNFAGIQQVLESQAATPTAVLLSHSHFDHTNLVDKFIKRYGCPIFMSKKEIDFYHFRCRNLRPFHENGRYRIGSHDVDVYNTPGHTAGSTCFAIGHNLFTGDTLFINGCGVCRGKGADPEQMFHSLALLKKNIPGYYHVYPSHSYGPLPDAPFEYVLTHNYYMKIEALDRFVSFRMRKNQKGLFAFK